MPSRRLHQKSRHGCNQCKKRRVKCDAIRSGCGNCRRRGSRCSFFEGLEESSTPNISNTVHKDAEAPISGCSKELQIASNTCPTVISEPSSILSTQETSWQSYTRLTIEPFPPAPIPQLTPQEFNLLHYYSTFTAASLSDIAHIRQVWQAVIPREALPYDFLVHGLIAFAAIHLANSCGGGGRQSPAFYHRIATWHQQRSLQSALVALNHITPANCHALFAFAGVTAFSTFVFPCPTKSPVDVMIDFLPVVRGTQTVLRSALGWISTGAMNPLIERQWDEWVFVGLSSFLNPTIRARLHELQEVNWRTAHNEAEYQRFFTAIERLIHAYETYRYIAEDRSLVFVWTVTVPESFVVELKARRPMALVVLAFYAVLVHSVEEQWWAKGRGKNLVEAIHEELPMEWREAVKWPMEVVRSEEPLLLGEGKGICEE